MSEIYSPILNSARTGAAIRYARACDAEYDVSYGFFIGCSAEWLLTHYFADQLRLDGYDIVRVRELTLCEFEFEKAAFMRRCIEIKTQTPVSPIGIRLDTTRELLESIVQHYPLVMIHRENLYPDECELGKLKMMSGETYALRWLTPTAEWADDERVYRYEDVTRITFGSEYDTTLAALAGLIPWRGANP